MHLKRFLSVKYLLIKGKCLNAAGIHYTDVVFYNLAYSEWISFQSGGGGGGGV